MGGTSGKGIGGGCCACSCHSRPQVNDVSIKEADLPGCGQSIDSEAEVDPGIFYDQAGFKKSLFLRTGLSPKLPVVLISGAQQEALHRAVARGEPTEIRELVERVPPEHRQVLLEHPDERGIRALHVAARAGNVEAVRVLAALASDVEALQLQADGAGRLPIHAASEAGQAEVLRVLADLPPGRRLLELRDGEGHAPTHIAGREGHSSVLRVLADMSPVGPACFLQKDARGQTVLHAAVEGKRVEAVIALIRLSPDPRALTEQRDSFGQPLIHTVTRFGSLDECSREHLAMASELLRAKCNTEDEYTVEGETLLTTAARLGHDIIHDVLMARADVGHETRSGVTALQYACLHGHTKLVDALLQAGSVLRHLDQAGRTPLMSAASGGHPHIVSQLLAGSADVDHAGGAGNTALLCAAKAGHRDTIVALVQARAEVLRANIHGNTALILACTAGSLESVKALLDAKADPKHIDSAGITALEQASYKGYDKIEKMLDRAINPTKINQAVDESKARGKRVVRGLRNKTKPGSNPTSPR